MKNEELKVDLPSMDSPVTENKRTVPPSGWGDSEHDTSLHVNLKPHSSIPNYDAKHGYYRHEE